MTNTATNTLPVWFVVAAWATLSVVLNVLGVLANQPDRPPIALLVSVIGPPILFVIAYFVRARSQSFTRPRSPFPETPSVRNGAQARSNVLKKIASKKRASAGTPLAGNKY